jgi:hypothetical protein
MPTTAPVKAQIPPSLISQIVGSQLPLLPGESAERYQEGLRSLIEEMGASTHMQVYLVQKMFDCMWEIRNYELASRGIIFNRMLLIISDANFRAKNSKLELVRAVHAGDWDNAMVKRALQEKGYTKESLYVLAVSNVHAQLQHLQQLSALRTKSMMQFQASFEALVNRPVLQERLRMQNEMMKRDLQAIEVTAEPASTGTVSVS